MRKDVKLGMAIGGGLIVLLIGYLLFAPPSNNNKKGTQLADGRGNIIESGGPGDLIGGNGSEDKPGKTGTEASGAPRGSEVTGSLRGTEASGTPRGGAGERPNTDTPGKTGDGTAKPAGKPESKPKTGTDPWNTLQTGKLTGPIAQKNPKEADQGKTGPHDTEEGHAITVDADPPAHRPSNPNDAWGGGVSTDAVLGSVAQSNHSDLTTGAGGGSRRSARGTGAAASGTGGSADKTGTGAGGSSVSGGAPAGGSTHIVKSGETLSSIALSAYGSSAYYPHILRANPGINPNNLKLGTPLKMPHINEVKADAPADRSTEHHSDPSSALEPKIDPSKQYRVQQGDSLYKIAMKVYGKPGYVERIYDKNKSLIGADNRHLKPGMVLDLPEKALAATASPSDATNSTLADPSTVEENQGR